jgi:hypothetical protein
MVLEVKPCPVATFPIMALLERQIDDVAEVNPTRNTLDNPEEEKPAPKTVILALPLDGTLVTEVEDTAPGTTMEMLNDPNPTRDALMTKFRTDPIPEATLNVKALSDTQTDLSDTDPWNLDLGEALMPKDMPNKDMMVLPDDGIELAFLKLEIRGAL